MQYVGLLSESSKMLELHSKNFSTTHLLITKFYPLRLNSLFVDPILRRVT